MPAITLGVAEVEEQLRRVRRRVNGLVVQQTAALVLSLTLLSLAGLLLAAMYLPPPLFRVAAWSLLALLVCAGVGTSLTARRRWTSVYAAARLADQRARLADRLATL